MRIMNGIRQLFAVAVLGLAAVNAPEALGQAQGRLYGWGHGINGMHLLPPGDDFVAVTGGSKHNLALRSDGTIVAWGDNRVGQLNVPNGPDNHFIAISTKANVSMALRSDGSITAWGPSAPVTNEVPIDYGFVSIASGNNFGIALRIDGSIVTWGSDRYFQVSNVPDVGGPNERYAVAIDAGTEFGLALLDDGSLVAWGEDRAGQVSDVPAGNDFVAISCGTNSCLALRSDGTIVGWGYSFALTGIPTEGGFIGIAAGNFDPDSSQSSSAIRWDGTVVQWPAPAGAEVQGDFLAMHANGKGVGIATSDPFDRSRPVDNSGRWRPVADGLLDTKTNLIWGFGANEVNHYLSGAPVGISFKSAQSMPVVNYGGSTQTYRAFSNSFFQRNDSGWRLPTLSEMKDAHQAGLVTYLDASPKPGFQKLGVVNSFDPVYNGGCWSSTAQGRSYGWWFNFLDGKSGYFDNTRSNFIPVRRGP
jgi:hypothetical protein